MWHRLRALTRREWGALLETALVCVGVELGLRALPLPRFLGMLRRYPTRSHPSPAVQTAELQRLAAAVFRRAPWRMTCLKQALVLLVLLRRRGLPATVRIGLATHGDALRAHAWIEHRGRVLLDDPAIARQFPGVMSLVSAA